MYFCTYFLYNISMKVQNKSPLAAIHDILRQQHGILLASDLARLGIPRSYLSVLENRGEIQRVARGQYAVPDALVDEMAGFQARYQAAVFSHETALYLHDLTDRSPLVYSVTLPSGYNATGMKAGGAKVYFVNRALFNLGLSSLPSPHGNDLRVFGLERTICDLLRSRNQLDIQFVGEALRRYAGRKDKNPPLLFEYATQFRIEKVVRHYIEVLL